MTLPLFYLAENGEIACNSGPAYEITPTAIIEHPIPKEGLPCPAPGQGESILVGTEHADWRAWTLPKVAEIMRRVVPHASTWCAPSFFGCDAQQSSGAENFAGMAYGSEGIALLRSTLAPREAVRLAYHEAYHLIEDARPWVGDVLDGLTDHGEAWPGVYLSRPEERRARCFETFALHLSEGGAVPLLGDLPRTLAAIYSGEIGREIVTSRIPPRPGILSRLAARTRELAHV